MPTFYARTYDHLNSPCQECEQAHLCMLKNLVKSNTDLANLIEGSYQIGAGETVCLAGESFNYLYVVKEGSIKDSTMTREGKERVADFYLAGEMIGLDAISEKKYISDAVALEPTKLCAVSFKKLLKLSEKITKLQKRLIYLISHKLFNRTHTLMENHQSAEQRVISFLIHIAKQYQQRGYKENNYKLTMSRHDIGSYLNLTTETVSRVLTKLQRENMLVASKKDIKLINLFQHY